MNRNEFIKKTIFSGLMIGGMQIYPDNRERENMKTIGNWYIPTIDYLLRGINRGCFYYIFFESSYPQEEFSKKFNLLKIPGIASNNIYFHINSFLRNFMSKLEKGNDSHDIVYAKHSTEQQRIKRLLNNAGFTNEEINDFNNRISFQKSICDKFNEINKKIADGYKKTISDDKAIIYIFDQCKYRDCEPRELLYFLREDEGIPLYIIQFHLTDITLQNLEVLGKEFDIPHISARVDFCTPEYLGFHSKIHYNILRDSIIDKEEI